MHLHDKCILLQRSEASDDKDRRITRITNSAVTEDTEEVGPNIYGLRKYYVIKYKYPFNKSLKKK